MENFTNPEIDIASLPDYAEVEFQPISRKYLVKSLVQTSGFMGIILIGWGVLFYLQWTPYPFLILIAVFLWFGFSFWNTFKLQNTYGFALREKDILYQSGFFVNKTTLVPFNRIQHVATTRGILDKYLGIATLNIFTAGGSGSDLKIPGLTPDLALRMKESLATKLTANEV